jgi:hypothetical protein
MGPLLASVIAIVSAYFCYKSAAQGNAKQVKTLQLPL